ncbi:MAG: plasmid pRiA4b ORF-3 family protein [Salibacteraceae bacterium]|nr:plasmid pRiA4b ORF-3 family protein [Salibacteraceae bacterium]
MKTVLQIRALLDYEKNVFRDIEIGADDHFGQLHDIIQEAFGFDNSQMASFYVSNEEWIKGREITLMDVGEKDENGDAILLMHHISVGDYLTEQSEKMIYVFDFLLMWCFYLDVISVSELEDTVILPRITQSFGDAPAQYSKSSDLMFEPEDEIYDPNEEYGSEDNEDDDIFGETGGTEDSYDENDY